MVSNICNFIYMQFHPYFLLKMLNFKKVNFTFEFNCLD